MGEVLYVSDVYTLCRRMEREAREARVSELLATRIELPDSEETKRVCADLRAAEQLNDEYAIHETRASEQIQRLEAELHEVQIQRDDAVAERDGLQLELDEQARGPKACRRSWKKCAPMPVA